MIIVLVTTADGMVAAMYLRIVAMIDAVQQRHRAIHGAVKAPGSRGALKAPRPGRPHPTRCLSRRAECGRRSHSVAAALVAVRPGTNNSLTFTDS